LQQRGQLTLVGLIAQLLISSIFGLFSRWGETRPYISATRDPWAPRDSYSDLAAEFVIGKAQLVSRMIAAFS
jgi:hypothetical protein